MGVYNKMVITNAGHNLLASAAGGSGVTYSSVRSGNGTYTGSETLETMTALKNQMQSFGISGVSKTGTTVKVSAVLNNDNLTSGYSVSEVGLYAKLTGGEEGSDVLFAIMVSDDDNQDYFPPYAEAPTSVTLEVYLTLSTEEGAVTFEALPVEGVYATAADLALKANTSDVTSALADKADLDENGRVPYSQLPESAMEFKGTWNASTNTPTLVHGVGTNGDFYVVSVGGTWDGMTFDDGDRILFDGTSTSWIRLAKGVENVNWDAVQNKPSTFPPSSHTHTKSDITDFPTSMTPTAHNQSASTISAGTLGGKVLANATAEATLGDSQVRNIYAGTSDMTAGTSNLATGSIYIMYE